MTIITHILVMLEKFCESYANLIQGLMAFGTLAAVYLSLELSKNKTRLRIIPQYYTLEKEEWFAVDIHNHGNHAVHLTENDVYLKPPFCAQISIHKNRVRLPHMASTHVPPGNEYLLNLASKAEFKRLLHDSIPKTGIGILDRFIHYWTVIIIETNTGQRFKTRLQHHISF